MSITVQGKGRKKKLMSLNLCSNNLAGWTGKSWKFLMPERVLLFKAGFVCDTNEIPIAPHCLHHYYIITVTCKYKARLIMFRECLRLLLASNPK